MASLGVFGDPEGWIHAGGSMNSVLQQLEEELDAADGSGGSGLRPHWYGPVADAHQDAWQQRRRRYDDLIGQVKPAAAAITDFGSRLADFQRRAWDLEQHWLGLGLHLTYDGLRFTLPPHHVSLPQELKLTFESLLGESERDIEAMWRDIDGAVHDLVSVLSRVAGGLEDFGFLGVLGTAFLLRWADGSTVSHIRNTVERMADGTEKFSERMAEMAKKYKGDVDKLENTFQDDASPGIKARLTSLEKNAEHGIEIGGRYAGVAKYAKFGGHVLMGIAVVEAARETGASIHKDGVERGIEEHLGDWASIAAAPVAGELVAAGAVALGLGAVAAGSALGAVAVVVGVGVVTAVVCVGVGWAVQHGADFVQEEFHEHRAAIEHAAASIGRDAGHAVNIGLKDVRNLL